MDTIKLIICAGLMSMTTSLWANTSTSNNENTNDTSGGLIAPYGNNPNIFHVFAYRTQEGIKNTASRVGAATERGWNKLKPKAKDAEEGIERTAQAAGQKLTDAKNAVLGDPKDGPAPIIQQPLDQNSNTSDLQPSNNQANTSSKVYPVTDL